MKYYCFSLILFVTMLVSCQSEKTPDEAERLLKTIEALYAEGQYKNALDSIERLRHDHPKALDQRKRALLLWREASLKLTQQDIGRTDSLLQACKEARKRETDIYKRNRLGVKCDSLQARYEALCGIVRKIHKQQEEE